ncbi:hypothetical protein D9619_010756 [Psilocybe cf. subviscida]|uniref:FIST domain-containing protein n=1 Tax=Psilocybe cf. subviscida TaxID=2480587 RepID=A0A8H5F0H9_9AGAR|nr:hypothetical protein D9619_010756 [Psilocybe cf. subviscida]
MPPIHLSTILVKTPSQLLTQLSHLSTKYGGNGHTILFALSANFSRPEDLQAAVTSLTTFNSGSRKGKEKDSGHVLGCLTDSFSASSFRSASRESLLSCAVGVFDSATCVPFRSTLASREQPQVGRWHAFRKGDEVGKDESANVDWENVGKGPVNWEDIWNQAESSAHPRRIQTLLTLSSPHPDALTSTFSEYLNKQATASSLTLIAAPTHFITGRGVTLFMDGEILGDGAIGLAFLRNEGQTEPPTWKSEFLGARKLSNSMTITSREGNMINALDDANPTRLLLDALETAGLGAARESQAAGSAFKDNEQFALGVVGPSGDVTRTFKITAGDPSSRGGSLSLDAPRAPDVGTMVQFVHHPSDASLVVPPALPGAKPAIGFLTVQEPDLTPDATVSSDKPQILQDTFLAPSTQGFIAQSSSEPSWTCSVPGGMVLLDCP